MISASGSELGRGGLAWRVLSHRGRRTAVAVSGIAFAILFMFMQLGLHGAVVNTALAVSSRLQADLVIVSSRYRHLAETGTLPQARLFQALALPGVEAVSPLYVRHARWKDPRTDGRCTMVAIAFPVGQGPPLSVGEAARQLPSLVPTGAVLVDSRSQSSCGRTAAGAEAEVNDHPVTVAGHFVLGVGFLGDGAMLMSDDTFFGLFGEHPRDQVHLGLVRLRPGASVPELARPAEWALEIGGAETLREILPPDSRVLTRAEMDDLQVRHWVRDTAVGNMFGLGTVLGFLVGTAVLWQVLSNDVRNHLPEYATLKAMGYADRQLYGFVLRQSWLFALLGFLPIVNALLLACIFQPAAFAAALIMLSLASMRLRTSRTEAWRELRLRYEEEPDPAVHTLNLLK